MDEHDVENVCKIVEAGQKWLERNNVRLCEEYMQTISGIVAREDIANAAFNSVTQLQLLQHVYVADLVNSVHGGDVKRAKELIRRIVGALNLQVTLDKYDYQQMLSEFPANEVTYGNDVNFTLAQACTALWVGDMECVRKLYYFLLECDKNGHLDGFNGDSCFLAFTIWMLGMDVSGRSNVQNLIEFGPYSALVEKFFDNDLLVNELIAAANFHLYRSADYPGAEPFPSFYGEVIGAYPAEILAYIKVRKRIASQESKVIHALIPKEWFGLEAGISATEPPFAKEIRARFAPAFLQ